MSERGARDYWRVKAPLPGVSPHLCTLEGTFFFVYMSVRRPKFCMSVGFSLPLSGKLSICWEAEVCYLRRGKKMVRMGDPRSQGRTERENRQKELPSQSQGHPWVGLPPSLL